MRGVRLSTIAPSRADGAPVGNGRASECVAAKQCLSCAAVVLCRVASCLEARLPARPEIEIPWLIK